MYSDLINNSAFIKLIKLIDKMEFSSKKLGIIKIEFSNY